MIYMHVTNINFSFFLAAHSTIITSPMPDTVFDIPEMQNAQFVGRDDVLEKLQNVLEDKKVTGSCKCVALIGLGGIGKTQVALEYCYQSHNTYQYIFWMRADSNMINSSSVKAAKQLNLAIGDTEKSDVIVAKM